MLFEAVQLGLDVGALGECLGFLGPCHLGHIFDH